MCIRDRGKGLQISVQAAQSIGVRRQGLETWVIGIGLLRLVLLRETGVNVHNTLLNDLLGTDVLVDFFDQRLATFTGQGRD